MGPARRLATDAEALLRQHRPAGRSDEMLLPLADLLMTLGDIDRARILVDEAVGAIRDTPDPLSRLVAFKRYAAVFAATGRLEEYAELAHGLIGSPWDDDVAAMFVAAGKLDRAERHVADAASSIRQDRARTKLASALVAAGAVERAAALVAEITDRFHLDQARGEVATAMATVGELERAEELSRTITAPRTSGRRAGRHAASYLRSGALTAPGAGRPASRTPGTGRRPGPDRVQPLVGSARSHHPGAAAAAEAGQLEIGTRLADRAEFAHPSGPRC